MVRLFHGFSFVLYVFRISIFPYFSELKFFCVSFFYYYHYYFIFLVLDQQSIFWTTFASIVSPTKEYFSTSTAMVNLFYAFGYIIMIPLLPFLGFTMTSPRLLRLCVIYSAFASMLGGLVRCLALFNPHSVGAVVWLCLGVL